MPNTMPDYFDSNMALLKEFHPKVWTKLSDPLIKPAGTVIQAANGHLNLVLNNEAGEPHFFHDPNAPESEVQFFLDIVTDDSKGVVAFFGNGLGYSPLGLLRARKNIRFLILFERFPEVFIQALKHTDLSELLADQRLILHIGDNPNIEELLSPAVLALKLEKTTILRHLPSFSLDLDEYQKIHDAFFSYASSLNVEGSTIKAYGKQFAKNRFKHIHTIHHDHLIDSLYNQFANIPAILVSGGPSLDQNIHLLSQAEGKAVIIAADSALPALLANGITPNFITSIDSNDLVFEKISSACTNNDISLLCSSWVTPKIPKVFPAKHIFWTFSKRPMEAWINNLLGGSIFTSGAGTVAHLSLISAITMGCSPIVFVGQDLAFTGDEDHAKHTVLNHRDFTKRVLQSEDAVWLEGIHGEEVASDRSFLSMKSHFENEIRYNPRHFINASAAGAHIKGTEVLPLQDVLDKYCTKNHQINQHIDTCAQNHKIDNTHLVKEFEGALPKFKKVRAEIKKVERVADSVTKDIEASPPGQDIHCFADLSELTKTNVREIDRIHATIDKEGLLWKLLQEMTLDGLSVNERNNHNSLILQSDPSRYVEWLSGEIARLHDINTARLEALDFFEKNIREVLTFLKKEAKIRQRLEAAPSDATACEQLSNLYFDYGDMVRGEKLMDASHHTHKTSFFKGCVAALRNNLPEAEKLWDSVHKSGSKQLDKKIAKFRSRLGKDFHSYASYFEKRDRDTYKHLLLKAFHSDNTNQEVVKGIQTLLQKDFDAYNDLLASPGEQDCRFTDRLVGWYGDIEASKSLSKVVSTADLLTFYQAIATIFIGENEINLAVEVLNKAISITPNDPHLHMAVAEVCFTTGKLEEGVTFLQKAISIAPEFAQYWESLGDILQQNDLHVDAISAFEQYFLHTPENFSVLKKIGDSYKAMGMTEAADEAYSQHLGKTNQSIEVTTSPATEALASC